MIIFCAATGNLLLTTFSGHVSSLLHAGNPCSSHDLSIFSTIVLSETYVCLLYLASTDPEPIFEGLRTKFCYKYIFSTLLFCNSLSSLH